jgi:cytochrome c-type biogenesis protein CcmH/NrfG
MIFAGWKVLAPAYKREQRWGDAADAYANILQLGPAHFRNYCRLLAKCLSLPVRAW